ncbi:MAG: hypothetical protein EP297_00495 [Gammaproteobacteria bacterium]|nr:MAG: hypothetical protein EP297_00495 [Gammaproteobacteria bacterium]
MKLYRRLILFLLFAWTFSTGVSAEQYLCVEEQATGFYFRSGQWKSTKFDADARFYLKNPDADDPQFSRYAYVLMEIGSEDPTGWCEKDFDTTGQTECESNRGNIVINNLTRRFLRTYSTGYISGFDDNRDTPHMAIGKCSPL